MKIRVIMKNFLIFFVLLTIGTKCIFGDNDRYSYCKMINCIPKEDVNTKTTCTFNNKNIIFALQKITDSFSRTLHDVVFVMDKLTLFLSSVTIDVSGLGSIIKDNTECVNALYRTYDQLEEEHTITQNIGRYSVDTSVGKLIKASVSLNHNINYLANGYETKLYGKFARAFTYIKGQLRLTINIWHKQLLDIERSFKNARFVIPDEIGDALEICMAIQNNLAFKFDEDFLQIPALVRNFQLLKKSLYAVVGVVIEIIRDGTAHHLNAIIYEFDNPINSMKYQLDFNNRIVREELSLINLYDSLSHKLANSTIQLFEIVNNVVCN